jgi:Arc/MetJ family transcription regulator
MARTTVDLDEKLMKDLMKATDAPTKKAAIEDAMRDKLNAIRRERLIARIGSGDMDMTLEELKAWRNMSKPRTFE